MSDYTIYQEPELFQPAYNDLMFVVKSDNNIETGYNYLADLYIGSRIIRLKAPAHPVHGSGVFNFGRIVESFVNSDIDKSTYGFQTNNRSFKPYHVSFGEEFGPSSGITQYPSITTTVDKYAWNAVLDFLDFQGYSQLDYLSDNTHSTLTRKIDRRIEITQDAWIYYVVNDTGSYNKAIVNAYDASGALIRSIDVTNPFTSSGTIENHFIRFSSGPNNLNLISSGYITDNVGTGDVIPANANSYVVKFSGSVGLSSEYTYYVTSSCKYPTYRLHFINELGAFDSFNFTKVGRKDIDISRSKYKASYGALTSSTSFGYNKSDRLDRTYFTSMKEGLKLKSDWLTEDEHEWLQELITSPEIYLDDEVNGLIAVTCMVNKIDVKTSLNDKLFTLDIDLDYSFNRYRQRS